LSSPEPLLLAASTGGHLAQLVRLEERLGRSPSSLWITFDTPQSRSLLQGRRVLSVPYVAPRDWRSVVRAFTQIRRTLAHDETIYREAFSTGAALALAALPAARMAGLPVTYIESVSRVQGPSMTGRLLVGLPGARRCTQHPHWAGRGWTVGPSVLDSFEPVQQKGVIRPRLFVTLGTIRPYRFDRMIEAVLSTGLADERTVWQTGVTSVRGLPGSVHAELSSDAFDEAILTSDVTITHSGVGTILRILELGRSPVVVPRERAYGEHVDDHQSQIAKHLAKSGLVTMSTPEQLTADVVRTASATGITLAAHS
jgi:UDP-N-acetylglucosamine--N-acetylmuramyl-(pentapeptide) pyrophosphoryl-undecaprenol N-acetylglucosamine transferase